MALPSTYHRVHQGQRHTYKTTLKHGGPRRLDYIGIPKTWLAATTKSLVLENFDAYTKVYDHKPVAVEIKGSILSRKALENIPRLDKRWIQTRQEVELQQAVQYAEQQDVLHGALNQLEHRHELIRILHVSAKKIKPMKPYVTDEILQVSARRTRLIKTVSREGAYAKQCDQRRVLTAWKDIARWIAKHQKPREEPLENFRESEANNFREHHKYQTLWHKAIKARAKATTAHTALRGYQRIQQQNLKQALRRYLDTLIEQASTVSVD